MKLVVLGFWRFLVIFFGFLESLDRKIQWVVERPVRPKFILYLHHSDEYRHRPSQP